MTDAEFRTKATAAFKAAGILAFKIIAEPGLVGATCTYLGVDYEMTILRVRPQDAAKHLENYVHAIARLPDDVRRSKTRGRPRPQI